MAVFTSTTHAVYVPDQWSAEMRVALEANLVVAKLVKMVTHDKKVKGDVIHIPDVSELTAADLSESESDITGVAPTEGEFTLTINKKKHISLYIPKHLGAQLSKYEMRQAYTPKISYGLAKIVDQDLLALFSGLSQAVGTTADGLNGNIADALILAAMEKLDVADINEDDRYLLLHARQRAKLLGIDKFVRADAVGNGDRITKRFMGDIYGMGSYFTTLVPTKLAGTAPATPVDSHANLLLNREAFALCMPQNVDMEYAWIPQKKAWFLSGDELYGVAQFRDLAGVVIFTKTTG
jgi:N4-gp56 family major capsid protein